MTQLYTKIFVGGLPWETRKDSLQGYFEQFGEIIEAVVIVDRSTGRSKGYGFVNFKDPDSATRACQNPYPVIDGRRANCNLAAFGAKKKGPTEPAAGIDRLGPAAPRFMAPLNTHGPSAYFNQQMPQYASPYSVYGYPIHPQDNFCNGWASSQFRSFDSSTSFLTVLQNNFYNAYGGKQLPFYYPAAASGSPGVYLNYYPFYAQHGQNSPSYYPRVIQNSQQHNAFGTLSNPNSASSLANTSLVSNRSKTCRDSRTTAMRVPITLSEILNRSHGLISYSKISSYHLRVNRM
ncbi:hypothetical protein NC653_034102 [Populus alba x Populus x berolinensis]|uniref:RRM domain-containing protein n=1 Tax=Populus alba x Populus x berolinensis TaxID=444605 RepID=A0AAD6PWQ5_9ROSI|nr:hypothetical protein NC653_034102 [Populus alba x Populus x berolinensis]